MQSRAGTESVEPRELYRVIEEKQVGVRGFMGSDRAYDFGGQQPTQVLGEEDRGLKVRFFVSFFFRLRFVGLLGLAQQRNVGACVAKSGGDRVDVGPVGIGVDEQRRAGG